MSLQTTNYAPSLKVKAAALLEYRRRRETAVVWQPNPDHENGTPNPQRLALESDADELFYGGAAGGGKTDLLLGTALTRHKRAVVFRRIYPNLDAIEQRIMELVGASNYNQSRHVYNGRDCRIEFESCQLERDKFKQQGRPRDMYGFDEITEFTKTQYQFIIGWNRTTTPGQRCRVICTGNPPMDDAGGWIVEEWGPWLQPDHPHRAAYGELRWYYYDENDHPVWLDSPDKVEINGRLIEVKSRTHIPASLDDNPHLGDDYLGRIYSMPEEIRAAMLGDFTASKRADPWQVIPTAWVKAAQRRWLEMAEPNAPMSGVGVDIVRGGKDKFALARRRGSYYLKVQTTAGVNVEDGPRAAGLIHQAIENEEYIGYVNIDVIGVGSSAYDSFKAIPRYAAVATAVNVGEGSSYIVYSTAGKKDPLFAMYNKRAEYHWRMREALDPVNGKGVALPPGNEIVADLCAAKYKLMAGSPPKIQIESKDDIKKRLGRSPDVGEAIMLANYEEKQYAPMKVVSYV